MEEMKLRAQDQDLKIEEYSVKFDRNHLKFEGIFDKWFDSYNKA